MSDLHLTADKHPIWGVDTHKQFCKALDCIKNIPNIDCVVVSGDIADDGIFFTYQYADDMLNSLYTPVLWCPGNHDDIETFYDFSKVSKSIIQKPLIINGVKIVPLNTVVSDEDNPKLNRSRGVFLEEDYQYLNMHMQGHNYPTILVMHHPSYDPGGWMTDKILKNRDTFNEAIAQYDNLFLILCGHIHYYMTQIINEKKLVSAPAVSFAFHKDLPKYEVDKGQEGFLIIDINNKDIKVEIVNI